MVYKKYKKKRPTRKRRKKTWRKNINKPDYSTKCSGSGVVQLQNSDTLPVRYSKAFAFSDITNYSNYKLWDQYRLNCIVVKITPNLTEVSNGPFDDTTNPGAGAMIPNYAVYVDRDDNSSTNADYESLKARQGTRISPCTKPMTIKFRPTRLLQVYKSLTSSGYMCDNSKSFLDDRGIPHYGIKVGIESGGVDNKFGLRIEYTYYVSFRSRRE